MITDYEDQTTYCRRLGHAVPFHYCREESRGRPCRLVLDCWWEQFDVQAALRDQLSAEEFDALRIPNPPPNKVITLLDLIQQARGRIEEPLPGDLDDEDSPLDPV